MSAIIPQNGLAEQIVALDAAGHDRSAIAIALQREGLSAEQASALVFEVLEADELGRIVKQPVDDRPGTPISRASRFVIRFFTSAAAVLAASVAVAWMSSFLPTIFDWVGLYGIGLLFGRLLATIAGVFFALIGIVMAADGRNHAMLTGSIAGAILFYGFVLEWTGG